MPLDKCGEYDHAKVAAVFQLLAVNPMRQSQTQLIVDTGSVNFFGASSMNNSKHAHGK